MSSAQDDEDRQLSTVSVGQAFYNITQYYQYYSILHVILGHTHFNILLHIGALSREHKVVLANQYYRILLSVDWVKFNITSILLNMI